MKQFREFITELFDKPAPIRLTLWDVDLVEYKAKIGSSDLEIRLSDTWGENTWKLSFYVNGAFGVTGGGNEIRVFSTVLSAIKDFLKRFKDKNNELPLKISFSARKGEDAGDSRVKLYKRLIKRFASQYGYRFEDSTDTIDRTLHIFLLIRK